MQDSLLQFFSLGAIGLLVFAAVFAALEAFGIRTLVRRLVIRHQMHAVFFFSLFASVCSLLLSLYFMLAPCELCWYQRMFLFPIPIISFIAAVRQDVRARIYVFALSAIGLCIALYHSLMQAGILKGAPAFCNPNAAIDCAVPQFVHFGFVTVPVISCAVFLIMLILSYAYKQE